MGISKIHDRVIEKQLQNEHDEEIPKETPKERCISPEEKQKIIDNLRLR